MGSELSRRVLFSEIPSLCLSSLILVSPSTSESAVCSGGKGCDGR